MLLPWQCDVTLLLSVNTYQANTCTIGTGIQPWSSRLLFWCFSHRSSLLCSWLWTDMRFVRRWHGFGYRNKVTTVQWQLKHGVRITELGKKKKFPHPPPRAVRSPATATSLFFFNCYFKSWSKWLTRTWFAWFLWKWFCGFFSKW